MTNFVRRPRGRNNMRSNNRRPNNNYRNSGSGQGQVVSLGEPGNSNPFGRNRNNGNRNTGNILKLLEKYRTLANDALASGDIILAESYFQHADHFVRQLPEQKPIVQADNAEEVEDNKNPDQDTSEEANASEENSEVVREETDNNISVK
jgi:hypothetical protein